MEVEEEEKRKNAVNRGHLVHLASRSDQFMYKGYTHTKTLHCMYIDSCTDIIYYCTQLVQMDCTYVYTNKHYFTTVHYIHPHYAWISCTAAHLYCNPVSAHLYCELVLTNAHVVE